MHICNKIVRKFTFRCDFIANGLHYATVLSRWASEFANEVGALEGTTVSLNAILFANGLHYATVLSRWAREFTNEVGALEGTTVSLNAILLQMGCIMP